LQKACIRISSPGEIKEAFLKITSKQLLNAGGSEELKRNYFVNVGSATDEVVREVYALLVR
jgi:hypothetical protein